MVSFWLINPIILPNSVSCPMVRTFPIPRPVVVIVPLKSLLLVLLSLLTEELSPVSMDSLTCMLKDSSSSMSAGILSPSLMITMSPGSSSRIGISDCCPSR